MIRRLVDAAARRRRAQATFLSLAGLDASLLDDIGLSPGEVEQLRPRAIGRRTAIGR